MYHISMLCMFVYTCVHVYSYVFVYVRVYSVCVRMYSYVFVCIRTCSYMFVCIPYVFVCIRTCSRVVVSIYVTTCSCLRMHLCVRVCDVPCRRRRRAVEGAGFSLRVSSDDADSTPRIHHTHHTNIDTLILLKLCLLHIYI